MGDRYELILNCAYCGSCNDDVWYAPTCSSDTFTCEKCGKTNFITDSALGFKAKKVEDVEYEEIEIGFLNTTNVSWTDEQVERICKERYNSIRNVNLSNSATQSDKSGFSKSLIKLNYVPNLLGGVQLNKMEDKNGQEK